MGVKEILLRLCKDAEQLLKMNDANHREHSVQLRVWEQPIMWGLALPELDFPVHSREVVAEIVVDNVCLYRQRRVMHGHLSNLVEEQTVLISLLCSVFNHGLFAAEQIKRELDKEKGLY